MGSKRRGFTLVEMLVVVAIISVIVALTLPGMRRFFKSRRVHDAALRFASTVERTKVAASKLKRPMVVARIDTEHFAVYFFDGTLAPGRYQPDETSGYAGGPVSDPHGGGTLPNPVPSRVRMENWSGRFSGNTLDALVIMNNGTFRRFQATAFGGVTTNPLGDIFRVQFADIDIEAGSDQIMKNVTTWNVDLQPGGTVSVRRLDSGDEKT